MKLTQNGKTYTLTQDAYIAARGECLTSVIVMEAVAIDEAGAKYKVTWTFDEPEGEYELDVFDYSTNYEITTD